MDTLSIKSPADVLSFISHGLGYWPAESLVCVTLDGNFIGATLRIDLPAHDDDPAVYAHKVAGYLKTDHDATSVVFGVYTAEPWIPGVPRPYRAAIDVLADTLARLGMPIRNGWLIGTKSFYAYPSEDSGCEPKATPLSHTETSQLNAELIYRGSSVRPTQHITLPAAAPMPGTTAAVEHHRDAIRALPAKVALDNARTLWGRVLSAGNYPTLEETAELLADFQFAAIRDRLIADIPGIDEPMVEILFAETTNRPRWSRVEWAEQILIHLHTHGAHDYAAPILTAIGLISWWEGRGSKAQQFLDLALETDPGYRLATLIIQMLRTGILSSWATHKLKAYRHL